MERYEGEIRRVMPLSRWRVFGNLISPLCLNRSGGWLKEVTVQRSWAWIGEAQTHALLHVIVVFVTAHPSVYILLLLITLRKPCGFIQQLIQYEVIP